MNKHIYIYAIIIIVVQIIIIFDLMHKRIEQKPFKQPTLTNTDTIYIQLDSLQKQQDTIKLYYEKEISNYHILPSSERIKLILKPH